MKDPNLEKDLISPPLDVESPANELSDTSSKRSNLSFNSEEGS